MTEKLTNVTYIPEKSPWSDDVITRLNTNFRNIRERVGLLATRSSVTIASTAWYNNRELKTILDVNNPNAEIQNPSTIAAGRAWVKHEITGANVNNVAYTDLFVMPHVEDTDESVRALADITSSGVLLVTHTSMENINKSTGGTVTIYLMFVASSSIPTRDLRYDIAVF